jgi:hypothetical protein
MIRVMRKSLVVLVLLLSCAAALAEDSSDTATVVFYRYKQVRGSVLRPSVYCDGKELARINNGQFLKVTLPAGPHTFYANDKQAGAEVTLESGHEYYFRTDLEVGFWKGHFRLLMVMPEQGKFDITKLKPLGPEF